MENATVSSRRGALRLAAACAVLAAVAVAATGASQASHSAAPSKPNFGSLTIVRTGDGENQFLVDLALRAHFFNNAGFNPVRIVNSGSGSVEVAALLSGSANISSGGTPEAVNAFNKGATDLRFIASFYKPNPIIITVTNAWQKAHPVPANATTCQKIQALKGAKVGDLGVGSTIDLTDKYIFTLCGMNPSSDVSLVSYGSTDSQYAGLVAGQIDVMTIAEPYNTQASVSGIGSNYVYAAQLPAFQGWMQSAFTALNSKLQANPDYYIAFLQAYLKAAKFAIAHPAAAAKYVYKQFPSVTPEIFDGAWNRDLAPHTGFLWLSANNPGMAASNVQALENFLGANFPPQNIIDSTYLEKAALALKGK
jgi:ABC-type nitrate/sulfonate/bicarbonate transport system substrate-binding protein